MSEESWDESLRSALKAVIAHEGNVAAASRRLHVDENVLRRFSGGKGISAANLQRLRAGLNRSPVMESAATQYDLESPARLAGRSFEIEALLAYALDRQRMLSASLGEAEQEAIRNSLRRSAEGPSQAKEA